MDPGKLINAYATHRRPPALGFPHTLVGRRDRSAPELAEHLDGFAGFITAGGTRPMTAIRYAVLGHVQRVQHHVAIEVESGQRGALAAWARDANAILLRADGSVRAPDGRVLVDAKTGDAEPGAEVPYPADALARKAASDTELAGRGVRVPSSLPPVIAEVEVELRTAEEVATRCLAVTVCALRAESLGAGQPISVEQLERRYALAIAAASPRERAFLTSDAPPRRDVVDHVWRYEAAAVLAWAVGALDELAFPGAIADVSALATAVLMPEPAAFVAAARLRPAAAILDGLDRTFRLHWATTEARVRGPAPLTGVDPGVVAERHHALNWLTRFEGADWDDVTTPT